MIKGVFAPKRDHGLHLGPIRRLEEGIKRLEVFGAGQRPALNPSATTLEKLLRSGNLNEFLMKLEEAELVGASSVHIDFFDPGYVGTHNLDVYTPALIRAIAETVNVPIDAHFMVRPKSRGGVPEFIRYLGSHIEAGASFVSVHWGAFRRDGYEDQIKQTLLAIRDMGACAGLVINPDEDAMELPCAQYADFILAMTVIPGRGGAGLDERGFANLAILKARNFPGLLGVDGAMNNETIIRAWQLGAKWAVVGAHLFGKEKLLDFAAMEQRALGMFQAIEAAR